MVFWHRQHVDRLSLGASQITFRKVWSSILLYGWWLWQHGSWRIGSICCYYSHTFVRQEGSFKEDLSQDLENLCDPVWVKEVSGMLWAIFCFFSSLDLICDQPWMQSRGRFLPGSFKNFFSKDNCLSFFSAWLCSGCQAYCSSGQVALTL